MSTLHGSVLLGVAFLGGTKSVTNLVNTTQVSAISSLGRSLLSPFFGDSSYLHCPQHPAVLAQREFLHSVPYSEAVPAGPFSPAQRQFLQTLAELTCPGQPGAPTGAWHQSQPAATER